MGKRGPRGREEEELLLTAHSVPGIAQALYMNFSFNFYNSPMKKWSPTQSHLIRWHCWECPRLSQCLCTKGLSDANWELRCGQSSQWAVIEAGSCIHRGVGRNPPGCLSVPATLRENEREAQLMVVDSSSSHHLLGVKGFLWSISFPTWNSLVL